MDDTEAQECVIWLKDQNYPKRCITKNLKKMFRRKMKRYKWENERLFYNVKQKVKLLKFLFILIYLL